LNRALLSISDIADHSQNNARFSVMPHMLLKDNCHSILAKNFLRLRQFEKQSVSDA
jgi:hypothetical protein